MRRLAITPDRLSEFNRKQLSLCIAIDADANATSCHSSSLCQDPRCRNSHARNTGSTQSSLNATRSSSGFYSYSVSVKIHLETSESVVSWLSGAKRPDGILFNNCRAGYLCRTTRLRSESIRGFTVYSRKCQQKHHLSNHSNKQLHSIWTITRIERAKFGLRGFSVIGELVMPSIGETPVIASFHTILTSLVSLDNSYPRGGKRWPTNSIFRRSLSDNEETKRLKEQRGRR
ncbi:hypothetical protein SISSUDRAFT_820344 [Sistotremastrum suecicum HHB10207 ss-3]|uniref:Uncharacterized protein n=1 Tax=Sistotremastrum suecicum HHB10207 ss-3 TaxID=1314776 RepID=A0A166CTA2_9AGAM|nr:hypothetical protein SISSUDRAFT_820344 [Sistotremastrum suecicum HHB10207 ss-3]